MSIVIHMHRVIIIVLWLFIMLLFIHYFFYYKVLFRVGSYVSPQKNNYRCYCVSDITYHPNLATVQYNVFFNLCRLKGVHFDLQVL
jgi:hypothetical protein